MQSSHLTNDFNLGAFSVEKSKSCLPSFALNSCLREFKAINTEVPAVNVDETLTAGGLLALKVMELWHRRRPFRADAVDVVWRIICKDIVQQGNRVWLAFKDSNEKRVPSVYLNIVDGNFVSLTGRSGWVNVQEGTEVQAIKDVPLEVVCYNLTKLLVLCTGESQHDHQKFDEKQPNRTSSLEESGAFCV